MARLTWPLFYLTTGLSIFLIALHLPGVLESDAGQPKSTAALVARVSELQALLDGDLCGTVHSEDTAKER
jgi:hypothetical protein